MENSRSKLMSCKCPLLTDTTARCMPKPRKPSISAHTIQVREILAVRSLLQCSVWVCCCFVSCSTGSAWLAKFVSGRPVSCCKHAIRPFFGMQLLAGIWWPAFASWWGGPPGKGGTSVCDHTKGTMMYITEAARQSLSQMTALCIGLICEATH